MKHKIECKNCGEIIELMEVDIDNQDILYLDCECCNCQNEVEVIYDDNNNVIDFRVY
jgi:hypothetical protein